MRRQASLSLLLGVGLVAACGDPANELFVDLRTDLVPGEGRRFRVGDVLSSGPSFEVRNFPRFAPEIFAQVAPREPSMAKGFGKALEQLGEEGVVQVFWPRHGAREPVLGAVGELQLEVFQWRLENEYGVDLRLDRKAWTRARWIKNVTDELIDVLPMVVAVVLVDSVANPIRRPKRSRRRLMPRLPMPKPRPPSTSSSPTAKPNKLLSKKRRPICARC